MVFLWSIGTWRYPLARLMFFWIEYITNHIWGPLGGPDMVVFVKHVVAEVALDDNHCRKDLNTSSEGVFKMQKGGMSVRVMTILWYHAIMILCHSDLLTRFETYFTIPYCSILCYTILYYIILYLCILYRIDYIVVYSTILDYIVLRCIMISHTCS